MNQLSEVNNQIAEVRDIVSFMDGNKYEQFDSSIDKIAAGGIGALVVGKVLAKVDFFGVILKFLAPILKFGKLAWVAIFGGLSFIWRLINGKPKEEELEELPQESEEKNTEI